jgi:hypothetical protein
MPVGHLCMYSKKSHIRHIHPLIQYNLSPIGKILPISVPFLYPTSYWVTLTNRRVRPGTGFPRRAGQSPAWKVSIANLGLSWSTATTACQVLTLGIKSKAVGSPQVRWQGRNREPGRETPQRKVVKVRGATLWTEERMMGLGKTELLKISGC